MTNWCFPHGLLRAGFTHFFLPRPAAGPTFNRGGLYFFPPSGARPPPKRGGSPVFLGPGAKGFCSLGGGRGGEGKLEGKKVKFQPAKGEKKTPKSGGGAGG